MAESAFLHIQDRESGPIRVVEIPWILVRIGRAAFCEVRLTGPDLEAEMCRLQRRGWTWYLVPTASSPSILVGGQAVQAPCPLPLGVPFRIGDHSFVLRKDPSSETIWGEYRTPDGSASHPSAAREPLSAIARQAEARPSPSPRNRVPSSPPHVPATAPGSFAETPPARPTPPAADNPWEARWRAAAARLKKDAKEDVGRRPSAYRAPDRYPGVPLKGSQEPAHATSPGELPTWTTPPRTQVPVPREPGFTPVSPAGTRSSANLGPPIEAGEKPRMPSWDRPLGTAGFDLTALAERDPVRPRNGDDEESRSVDAALPGEPSSPAPEAPGSFETNPLITTSAPQEPCLPGPGEDLVDEVRVPDREVPAEAEELVAEVAAADPSPCVEPDVLSVSEPGDEVPVTHGTSADDRRHEDHSAWFQYDSRDPRNPAAVPSPVNPEVEKPAPELPQGEPVALLIVTCEYAAGVSVRQDLVPPPGFDEPYGTHLVNLGTPDLSPVESREVREESFAGDRLSFTGSMEPSAPAEETAGRPTGEPTASAASRPDVRTATLLGAGDSSDPSRRAWSDTARSGPEAWTGTRPGDKRTATAWDLPSAQDILASVGKRPAAQTGPPPTSASWDRGVATLAREPDHWRPPAWLAWPPAALLVLVLGLGGTFLTVRWTRDSYNASVVHQRLLAQGANGARNKPLPEGVEPPRASWWATTPIRLTQWSHYLDRSRDGEQRADEVRELLEAAIRIAPLHPAARLSRAGRDDGADEPARLARSLGLSRDAVSLGWCARVLRRKGKTEAAVKLYREALEIACRVERVPGVELGFSDDPAVRRYLLPGESQALPILRDLASDDSWDFKEWSRAVPTDTVAELAAARVLRERGKSESEPLLERLASAVVEAEEGQALAIRLAVKAEASALLSRWKESEQAYRRAIDIAMDPTARRSWWFNLANIESRLDDQRQRDLALHAALEASAGDDISRRALEIQRGAEPLSRLRPGGPRAN